jgi:hypothetical protein
LPTPYFHTVFTRPHELSALALGNRELMDRWLFNSASQTLLEVAADPKHLGARIGVLMVLHTWGQQWEHHPHVPCVVPGGGLAVSPGCPTGADSPRWVSCRPHGFLPVEVLSRVFRGKYLAALRAAHEQGQLQFAASTSALAAPTSGRSFMGVLYQKEWVVYVQEPFGGPEPVLKYRTGYTHRVALSHHRLVKLEDGRVTLTWKDYADGGRRNELTLEAVEFVRRFAMPIVPKGLVRIRQYGLLAHRDRGERLALCRSLLATVGPPMARETEPPQPPWTSSDRLVLPTGAAPAPSIVEPKPVSPSWMGVCVLALLLPLVLGAGADTAATSSSSSALALLMTAVDDRCPHCGVGRMETIWRANRPSASQLQSVPILDSS